MIRRKAEMSTEIRENIRGGHGSLHCVNLMERNPEGKVLYCALMHFKPGESIGLHPHGPDAEIYYALKGKFHVNDNGTDSDLDEGDLMYTSNGEQHCIENRGTEPAQLMAIVIA
jgi:mannose-6-phosphate isomerase-like protein (cupin superfamily)